ncbi:MAG: tetratricopeptide repeat protein [Aulosira sp. DedQUE10]|nr:tetratricopeptide repeat protein [Aulosira sp. DedQUE10]
MRTQTIFLAVVAVWITVSTSLPVNLTMMFAVAPALAQTPNQQKAAADKLLKQGYEKFYISQFDAAIQYWQQALTIYKDIKELYGQGAALDSLGRAYNELGDYTKAIVYLQQALVIAQEIGAKQGESATLGNIGNAYHALGDYIKAIDYQHQSLAIAQEIKDRKGEGQALGNLGNNYFSLGQYIKARDYYQQSLAIARAVNDHITQGNLLGNLGETYRQLGDFSQAIDYQQQSLANARKINNRSGEAAALGGIGNAYYALAEYAKAIDYHQQSLTIALAIKDREREGKALGNLGNAYSGLGDYAKAIDYQRQWLIVARTIKDRQSEGAAFVNLGNIYDTLGEYAKAVESYEQSLAIARAIKDRQNEGSALGNLGITYRNLGEYTKAIEYHQQQLAIAREIQDPQGQMLALASLGNGTASMGDYTKAINYYQQSLAIAGQIQDRSGEALGLGSLAIAYLYQGDYPKTIDYTQQTLVIARQLQERQTEGEALHNLGFAFYKSGNLPQAESYFLAAIKVWESQRSRLGKKNDAFKISSFEGQFHTYHWLQKVLINQNKSDTALEIAERGRARAFVDLLAAKLSPTEVASLPSPNLEQIKQIAQTHQATLVQYSIIYDELLIQGKPQAKESELYIWVVKPTGAVTFRKVDLKTLAEKEKTSLVAIAKKILTTNPGLWSKSLKALHQILIQPIADQLPTNPQDRVIFIPQSALFLVPFPALQDANGQYLIEKHTILTSPSIQVLALTQQQKQKVKQAALNEALVVGNPTMPKVSPAIGQPPEQLPPLPAAEEEAKAIAPLLQTQALIGNKATKAAILPLLPKARIIHLATHGIFDEIRGLGSAVALAPSGQDNGLLTAEEILEGVKLNAELVVLSACKTGRGRITGDGIIGLSRSLISAGTPSVIITLWDVDDEATASLMTEFYQNLQQNPDKAVALRTAMLNKVKQRLNPIYWAAFTLVGEAE